MIGLPFVFFAGGGPLNDQVSGDFRDFDAKVNVIGEQRRIRTHSGELLVHSAEGMMTGNSQG